jgi:hypothetical protein
MWTSFRRLLLTLCAAWGVAACSDITFVGGGPVTIELSVDRSRVAVGDSVTFTYDVKGTYIVRIVFEYGDGAVDSVSTLGAQKASGEVSHAFGLPGSYAVVGRAEDSATGTATAQVVVEVEGD